MTMKRLGFSVLAVVLIGSTCIAGGAGAATGTGKTVSNNSHSTTRSIGSSARMGSMNGYVSTLLVPLGGSRVSGAVAILRGTSGMTGTSSSGSSGASGSTSGTMDTVAIIASGLRPGSKAVARLVKGTCGASTGTSGAGTSGGSGSGNTGSSSSSGSATAGTYESPTMMTMPWGDAMIITATTMTSAVGRTGWAAIIFGTPGSGMAPGTTGPTTGGSSSMMGAPAGMTAVACGTLHTAGTTVQLSPDMGGKAVGIAMITQRIGVLMPQDVTTAMPRLAQGTEVVVFATGLQPGLAHPTHIHAGPCGKASTILIPLIGLIADSQGQAVSGTALPLTTSLAGFSIHVHQPNGNPDACGTIGGIGGTTMTP